jgi:hypothetical protein
MHLSADISCATTLPEKGIGGLLWEFFFLVCYFFQKLSPILGIFPPVAFLTNDRLGLFRAGH